MPTYQYACTECGEQLEVVQKFTDDALTECPACSGGLRKVFSAVGVVFKGSGFYRTDSRTGSSKESAKSTSATETKSGEKKSAEKKSGADSAASKKSDSGTAKKSESKAVAAS